MEAKERRSGKPSSIAAKPAEEIACNLDSRVSSDVPIETDAKDVGIPLRELRVSDMMDYSVNEDFFGRRVRFEGGMCLHSLR